MMKKIIILLCVVVCLCPILVFGLSEEQVKSNGKKGDIYNPEMNQVGNSAIINAFHYANGEVYSNGDVEVQKIVRKTNTEGKYNVEFKIRGKNA